MANYSKHFNSVATPQTKPIPGKKMVANNGGGYSFKADDWTRFKRWLILGSEGGTYYASESKLTVESANALIRCIKEDGLRVVNEIVDVSQNNRSAKNDTAIFALALCSSPKYADEKVRAYALENLSKVARTGTHLFHFARDLAAVRGGWARSTRRAFANFYLNKPLKSLVKFVTKYKQRDGYSQRDLLRLSHPKTIDTTRNSVFRYVVKGELPELSPSELEGDSAFALDYIKAVEELKTASNTRVLELVKQYEFPMEVIPTEKLSNEVFEVLIKTSGLTWLIRNLGNLSKRGVLSVGRFDAINLVVSRLTNQEALVKERVHPIAILNAMLTYKSGHGLRGSGTWTVVPQVVGALDEAFYKSFKSIEPTGKKFCLGLDVSGSMSGTKVFGLDNFDCRSACGAMALVTANTEPNNVILGFDTKIYNLDISPKQRLDNVVNTLSRTGGGGTDCSLPIKFCRQNNIPIDVFVIYTDSQLNTHNSIHPIQEFDLYKKSVNADARLVTVQMAANRFSLSEVGRPDNLDLIGFDLNTPKILNAFTLGEV